MNSYLSSLRCFEGDESRIELRLCHKIELHVAWQQLDVHSKVKNGPRLPRHINWGECIMFSPPAKLGLRFHLCTRVLDSEWSHPFDVRHQKEVVSGLTSCIALKQLKMKYRKRNVGAIGAIFPHHHHHHRHHHHKAVESGAVKEEVDNDNSNSIGNGNGNDNGSDASDSDSTASGSNSSDSDHDEFSSDDGIVLHAKDADTGVTFQETTTDTSGNGDYLRRHSSNDGLGNDNNDFATINRAGGQKAVFNVSSSGRENDGNKRKILLQSRRCRFDVGIHSALGASVYHNTTVVTFLPRYVLLNNLHHPIEITQSGSDKDWKLVVPEATCTGFHWPFKDRKQTVMVRKDEKGGGGGGLVDKSWSWGWSGEFSIDSLGEETIKVSNEIVCGGTA